MAWAAGHRLCSKEQSNAAENIHSQPTHMDESKCAGASPVAGILKVNVHIECGGTYEWLNNKNQLIWSFLKKNQLIKLIWRRITL